MTESNIEGAAYLKYFKFTMLLKSLLGLGLLGINRS